jgi:hypothetical protein
VRIRPGKDLTAVADKKERSGIDAADADAVKPSFDNHTAPSWDTASANARRLSSPT